MSDNYDNDILVDNLVWEMGGGYTRTGWAVVWADPDGRPPLAVEIVDRGHRACGRHVGFALVPGMVRVTVDRNRGGEVVAVERWDGEQFVPVDGEDLERYREAIEVARYKARTYHCRDGMHYSFRRDDGSIVAVVGDEVRRYD